MPLLPGTPANMRFESWEGIRDRDVSEIAMGRLIPRKSQFSWLELLGEHVIVYRFGNEYGNYSLKRTGYWEWERLCEVRPKDFTTFR